MEHLCEAAQSSGDQPASWPPDTPALARQAVNAGNPIGRDDTAPLSSTPALLVPSRVRPARRHVGLHRHDAPAVAGDDGPVRHQSLVHRRHGRPDRFHQRQLASASRTARTRPSGISTRPIVDGAGAGPTSSTTPGQPRRLQRCTSATTGRTPCRAARRVVPKCRGRAIFGIRQVPLPWRQQPATTAGRSAWRFPYGDYAGLDTSGVGRSSTMSWPTHATPTLTFVFGHHPVTDTGVSDDTWLFYGYQEFIRRAWLLRATSAYNFGHTHRTLAGVVHGRPAYRADGRRWCPLLQRRIAREGQSEFLRRDCDRLRRRVVGNENVAVVAGRADHRAGRQVRRRRRRNPYAYTVPASQPRTSSARWCSTRRTSHPGAVTGSTAAPRGTPMTQCRRRLARLAGRVERVGAPAGDHTIEVQAIGHDARCRTSSRCDVDDRRRNRAPVAANDTYAAFSGQTLNVAAPGVLANDSDPDGDTLSAERVSGPYHGSITLISDGSFTYTPAAGYAGADSFTYT